MKKMWSLWILGPFLSLAVAVTGCGGPETAPEDSDTSTGEIELTEEEEAGERAYGN